MTTERGGFRPWAWTAAVLFVAAFGFRADAQPATAEDTLVEKGLQQLDGQEAALKRAIDRALPSVVSIFLAERLDGDNFLDGNQISRLRESAEDRDVTASGVGSGLVLDRQGRILTCYHLVRPTVRSARYELRVRTAASGIFGGQGSRIKILAADPRSDLAVIQIQGGEEVANLKPIVLGDGSKLFRGQYVLAIGNPFGVGNADGMTSASLGLISNIGRRAEPMTPAAATASAERSQSLQYWGSLLQVDCRLNMGTSGGALINTRGELVGVTMALAARTGLETPGGFALPTDDLTRRTIEALRQGKEVEYGFLGIRPKNITAAAARIIHYLPVDGVQVGDVVLYGSRRGGLARDDVIIAINGQTVRNSNELVLRVGSLPAGQELTMEVVRGLKRLELKVKLGKYPVSGEIIATNRRPLWNGLRVDYLSTLANSTQFNDFGRTDSLGSGVAVAEVAAGSPADRSGLSINSVISAVNGRPVEDPDEFDRAVAGVKGPVRLTVSIDGRDKDYVLPPQTSAPKPAKRFNED